MGTRRWLAALTVSAGLVLAGCGDGEDRPGQVTEEGGSGSGTGSGSGSGTHGHESAPAAFAESEATTRVVVSMTNFAFNGVPATVKGPKVFFSATNDSPTEHELIVVDSKGGEVGEVHVEAGKTGTLAVELAPGTYSVECHVMEGAKPHSDLGMKTPLRVE